LVNFAKFSGYEYKGTNEANYIEVHTPNDEIKKFKFLYSLEFNSTRKRHSVVVEDEKGKIMVLCKGADTIIYERICNKER
jgi:phospholipid-translocating ATPase